MFDVMGFIQCSIQQGVPLLYGSTGEIVTQKSGNLNLGIPGVMYVGAISSIIGSFFFEKNVLSGADYTGTTAFFINMLTILVPVLSCILGSLIMGLIYCFLTVTLRANQNVTGLAMTTFGVGFGNFFGGSLAKLSGGAEATSISLTATGKFFKASLPFAEKMGGVGKLFLSYGFLTYLSFAVAIAATIILTRTRTGLHLRAVGENPATADSAGISVTMYKYGATCIGCVIAGFGGMYYVMEYMGGKWSNDAFGDRGWLAIALVIVTIWKPSVSIIASTIFGGLCYLFLFYNNPDHMAVGEAIKMIPYVATLIVLVISSMRDKRENQPPASLGLPYFREER